MKRLSARDYAQALASAYHQAETSQRQEIVKNFLGLLRRQRASSLLPRIIDNLQTLGDAAERRTRVIVTTAKPMSAEHLQERLTKALGQVVITSSVNPALIGGLTLRVGDQLVDGSVQTQLHHLYTHLTTAHA